MANQKQAAKAAARQAAQEKAKQQQKKKTIFTWAGIALIAVALVLGGVALFGGGTVSYTHLTLPTKA